MRMGCFRNPDGVMLTLLQYKRHKDHLLALAELTGSITNGKSEEAQLIEQISPEKKEVIEEVKNILKNLKI